MLYQKRHYRRYDQDVGRTPLIRGCRSLILNELIIKITGKNSYEIEYR